MKLKGLLMRPKSKDGFMEGGPIRGRPNLAKDSNRLVGFRIRSGW
jgi:hypothetical protein